MRPFLKLMTILMALSMAVPIIPALGSGPDNDDGVSPLGGQGPLMDIVDHRLINATYNTRIPPTIDGVISPNEWDTAESSFALKSRIPPSWEETGSHIAGPGIMNDSDASHWFWTLYDDDYLYFLFNCSDDNITVDSYPDAFWRDDSIEIAIDGAYDRDENQRTDEGFEDGDTFAVVAGPYDGIAYSLSNANQYARYWGPNRDWFSAVTVHSEENASYYIVEVMIRLNTISNPSPGSRIGLNTGQNDDDDGNTTKEGVIRWQGLDGYAVWQNETLWGDLYFRTHVVADAGVLQVVNQSDVVQFDGSASTSNYPNFTVEGEYTWTFMYDGAPVTLTGPNPSFQFDIPGQYLVTLNVTDGTGSWATDTVNIGVRDTEDPVANAGPDVTVDQGSPVTLDGSASTDNHPDFPEMATFEWFFIDDKVVRLNGMVVEYTFQRPGQYIVRLTVTDPSGDNQATDTMNVTVRDVEAPEANAGADITVDDGQLVSFDGTNSTDNYEIVRMVWEFELDGEPVNLTGKTPKYKFPHPGVYTITLTVFDGDGQFDTDEMTVTVVDVTPPLARAGEVREFNEDVEVTLNAELSFDNVGIVLYNWTITHGGTVLEELEGMKVKYTFTEPGLYDITLYVEDAMGLSSEDTVQYSVTDVTKPVAKAGNDRTVDEDTTVTFTASESSDNVGIESYNWTISAGPGEPTIRRTGESFDYVFTMPGVYTVTLVCTDKELLWDSDAVTVTVLDVTAPAAVPPNSVKVLPGQEVELDGRSSTDNVGITEYLWTYEISGVPFSYTGALINLTFDAQGNNTITLKVTDAAGNTDNATFYVLVEKPKKQEEEPGFGVLMAVAAVSIIAALAKGRRRG